MKNLYSILILILVLSQLSQAANDIDAKIQAKLSSRNSMGRLFYVAFPPNDANTVAADALEIFISSSVNTTVNLSNNSGLNITKNVQAGKVARFSSKDGDFGTDLENFTSGIALNTGLRLESPDLISVYVINSKPVSSDGYMAIPVNQWGKRNINVSYWDFKEVVGWKSGFMILASENNTSATISLNGRTGGQKTDNGNSIGQTIKVTLNKGQIYMFRGDGTSRGEFDMTGSEVISDKNVGLISFHERCMIPVFVVDNGRDHICEMIPPVQAWGKKYVSVELKRKNYGDYFRVVTSADNTTVKYTSYDIDTKQMIESSTITIQNANEFVEYKTIYESGPRTDPSKYGIRGVTVWESDKPIHLMQYSCSEQWDQAGSLFDPDMMNITAVEQYTTKAVFSTPQNNSPNEFRVNYLNICMIGDTNDYTANDKLLKTVKLNGKLVATYDPKLTLNRVPYTNFYFARVSLDAGAYILESETPVGATMYGFSNANGYAWQAISGFKNLKNTNRFDTLAPVVNVERNKTKYTLKIKELRDGDIADVPRQVDSGIESMPFLVLGSTNFSQPSLDPKYSLNPSRRDLFELELQVIDPAIDAIANIRITDAELNDTLVTIRYVADKFLLQPLTFKNTRVNKSSDKFAFDINSYSDSTIYIESIKLKDGKVFEITDSLAKDNNGKILLKPFEKKIIYLKYKPIYEYNTITKNRDIDSLIIQTSTLQFSEEISGRGVAPRIQVDVCNFGNVPINSNNIKFNGVEIRNPGTDTLTIRGVDKTNAELAPFKFDRLDDSNFFPFKIPPFSKFNLSSFTAKSDSTGKFIKELKLLTDIDNPIAKDDSVIVFDAYFFDPTSVESEENRGFELLPINPNPISTGNINANFKVGINTEVKLEIINTAGELMSIAFAKDLNVGIYNFPINIQNLPNGVYYLKLVADKFEQVQKFVIAK